MEGFQVLTFYTYCSGKKDSSAECISHKAFCVNPHIAPINGKG